MLPIVTFQMKDLLHLLLMSAEKISLQNFKTLLKKKNFSTIYFEYR